MKKKVSIVIPNYNGRRLLEKNLPRLMAVLNDDTEVVIVDDASTDDSVSFIQEHYPWIKLVKHENNMRFAQACNSGVRAAEGEIVVLLNNDVIPLAGFLDPLIEHFSDDLVFAVGCREQDRVGDKLIYSGRGMGDFRRGFLVHWRAADQNNFGPTLWASGGSAAYSRQIWLELGGMDRLFRPAYEEDRDISYRALKMGYKVLFEPRSQVVHKHETTNIKELGSKRMKSASFKNQFLFVWKNITDWDWLAGHVLWLPYHLIVTSLRTRGVFLLGFWQALKQLPQALKQRRRTIRTFIMGDKELIAKVRG